MLDCHVIWLSNVIDVFRLGGRFTNAKVNMAPCLASQQYYVEWKEMGKAAQLNDGGFGFVKEAACDGQIFSH